MAGTRGWGTRCAVVFAVTVSSLVGASVAVGPAAAAVAPAEIRIAAPAVPAAAGAQARGGVRAGIDPRGQQAAAVLEQRTWMRRLRSGERPPQFVLFSFDGVGSHEHWRRILAVAAEVDAHVTGFLSGTYLLSDEQRGRYHGPGHPPGAASIGFGGPPARVAARVADLNDALAAGHEIGTHYNGHFCRGAEPSMGSWDTAMWNSELDQFFDFVRDADGLRLPASAVRGGRTPCLEGRWDQALLAMRAHGFSYDSSRPSNGVIWPSLVEGVWEFWMPIVAMPTLHRRAIMMDYNLWFALNDARDQPGRAAEFTRAALGTYRAAYRAAASSNRAPLEVGNHFNDWAGGAFSTAVEQFMAEVCQAPETRCATHTEVLTWMALQDPAVLDAYRARPPASP